ncbi:hypothetical protein M405DRAFT_834597 [Rhizopogon salebrosus TDB-379]|nr:hypothetical protein M405DRAFT_834597 [Rhizopogon salebrosus TDB-379]
MLLIRYSSTVMIASDLKMLTISGIAPHPMVLVFTIDEQGVENLSPFNWFNMVSGTQKNFPQLSKLRARCWDLGASWPGFGQRSCS